MQNSDPRFRAGLTGNAAKVLVTDKSFLPAFKIVGVIEQSRDPLYGKIDLS
jgi:hypothetical protein